MKKMAYLNGKNRALFLGLMIIFITIFSVNAFNINQFNDSTTQGVLSLNPNSTEYLKVPQNTLLTNGIFNISYPAFSPSNPNQFSFYDNFSNFSMWTTYAQSSGGGGPASWDNTTLPGYAYGHVYVASASPVSETIYLNNTQPILNIGGYSQDITIGFNFTNNIGSCSSSVSSINLGNTQIIGEIGTGNNYRLNYYWTNSTNINYSIDPGTGVYGTYTNLNIPNPSNSQLQFVVSSATGPGTCDSYMTIYYVNYTTINSLSLSVGSSLAFFTPAQNGSTYQTITTSNLANYINNYLILCSYKNGYCNVPFVFSSNFPININYSALNFNNTGFLDNGQKFNPSTYLGNQENFAINITYDPNNYPSMVANLVYNNTNYPSGQIFTYGYNKLVTANITIPSLPTGSNIPFYWSFKFTNSSGGLEYYNSTNNTQYINTASTLQVANSCPVGMSPSYNFTSFWEQNLTAVNMSLINYFINYGPAGNPNLYYINGSLNSTGQFSICINNTQPSYSLGSAEIDYYVTGAINRRYFLFSGTKVTNQTVSIPLYSLETTASTTFQLTAETTTLIPYTQNYIGLLRWYPNLNSYQTIEMGTTDGYGNSVLHIQTDTASYRLALYDEYGNIIDLLNPIQFICQTTPCTYTISVNPTPLNLQTYTNIQSNLSFDSVNNVFNFIWNDPSQQQETMNLTINEGDQIICSNTASGYTGAISCNVNGYSGILTANVYLDPDGVTTFSQLQSDLRSSFINSGGDTIGLFIGAMLLILFSLIGAFNPVLVVVLGIVALIPLFLLGNITVGVLMAIGVLGGVILHFMKRTNG
jgi:hypothetical protein